MQGRLEFPAPSLTKPEPAEFIVVAESDVWQLITKAWRASNCQLSKPEAASNFQQHVVAESGVTFSAMIGFPISWTSHVRYTDALKAANNLFQMHRDAERSLQ